MQMLLINYSRNQPTSDGANCRALTAPLPLSLPPTLRQRVGLPDFVVHRPVTADGKCCPTHTHTHTYVQWIQKAIPATYCGNSESASG